MYCWKWPWWTVSLSWLWKFQLAVSRLVVNITSRHAWSQHPWLVILRPIACQTWFDWMVTGNWKPDEPLQIWLQVKTKVCPECRFICSDHFLHPFVTACMQTASKHFNPIWKTGAVSNESLRILLVLGSPIVDLASHFPHRSTMATELRSGWGKPRQTSICRPCSGDSLRRLDSLCRRNAAKSLGRATAWRRTWRVMRTDAAHLGLKFKDYIVLNDLLPQFLERLSTVPRWVPDCSLRHIPTWLLDLLVLRASVNVQTSVRLLHEPVRHENRPEVWHCRCQ